MPPKVAILTPLVDFSSAYSPTGIILDQARMLARAGYDYDLLALKNFNRRDRERQEKDPRMPRAARYVLPQTRLHDYAWNEKPHDDFEEQVDRHFGGDPTDEVVEGYQRALEPYDVVITHDLMFLGWHLPQNAAIRRCVELWGAKKRWLHWIHSAPSGLPGEQPPYPSSLRFTGCPHSRYVYLNAMQRQDVVNHFQLSSIRDVAIVYNTRDPRDLWGFADETCRLIDRHRLLDAKILQIYAFSTPRWQSKGVHKLLRLWGFWRRSGINAKLVLVNAHCTQEKDEREVAHMEDYAKKYGLVLGEDVIWTSRFAAEQDRQADRVSVRTEGGDSEAAQSVIDWNAWRSGVPARVVRELVSISNLFVFPTFSECCSLIQAEAAISGKLMVLNRNCPQTLEFAESGCLAFNLGEDPDRNPLFYECLARELWSYMQADPQFLTTARARGEWYNRDWIWRNQLQPLIDGMTEGV